MFENKLMFEKRMRKKGRNMPEDEQSSRTRLAAGPIHGLKPRFSDEI